MVLLQNWKKKNKPLIYIFIFIVIKLFCCTNPPLEKLFIKYWIYTGTQQINIITGCLTLFAVRGFPSLLLSTVSKIQWRSFVPVFICCLCYRSVDSYWLVYRHHSAVWWNLRTLYTNIICIQHHYARFFCVTEWTIFNTIQYFWVTMKVQSTVAYRL